MHISETADGTLDVAKLEGNPGCTHTPALKPCSTYCLGFKSKVDQRKKKTLSVD